MALIYGSGLNVGKLYDLAPKYGMSDWDINSIFFIMTPGFIGPFAYYYSYSGVGKNCTEFVDMYLQCSAEIKGNT